MDGSSTQGMNISSLLSTSSNRVEWGKLRWLSNVCCWRPYLHQTEKARRGICVSGGSALGFDRVVRPLASVTVYWPSRLAFNNEVRKPRNEVLKSPLNDGSQTEPRYRQIVIWQATWLYITEGETRNAVHGVTCSA